MLIAELNVIYQLVTFDCCGFILIQYNRIERFFYSYKRATRSFRMFAMVRSEQITQMERDFRTGDLCMHDAIITVSWLISDRVLQDY